MSKYGIQTRAWDFKYPPMPLEKRRALLPKRSVSSLYPAKADIDVMVTGNGKQRIDVIGEPYQERIIFKRERIMDMRWKNTPEPPDIAYAIPECRRLLLQGKFAEAAKMMDQATRDAGYDKWLDKRPFGVEFPRLHPRLHSAMELLLECSEGRECRDYLRYLDMLSGEITVPSER